MQKLNEYKFENQKKLLSAMDGSNIGLMMKSDGREAPQNDLNLHNFTFKQKHEIDG